MKTKRGMNKKGFELVWSNVVAMVLAFAILLTLILFFTSSSGSFMERIKSYFSYSNVDSVVSGCNILIDSGQDYSFCCEKKLVKYYDENDEEKEAEFSCFELADEDFISGLKELNCDGVC